MEIRVLSVFKICFLYCNTGGESFDPPGEGIGVTLNLQEIQVNRECATL
jgi:hypothetical protein